MSCTHGQYPALGPDEAESTAGTLSTSRDSSGCERFIPRDAGAIGKQWNLFVSLDQDQAQLGLTSKQQPKFRGVLVGNTSEETLGACFCEEEFRGA